MAKKHTKKALFASVMSLVLCFAMLVGTTFAWFTDSVTSGNNIIKSGNLDVEMYWAEGTEDPDSVTWTDASVGPIFTCELWEPGYTEVRHIKIENKGSLALKYQIMIQPNGEVSNLVDVIDVYYADPAVQVANRSALNEVPALATLRNALTQMPETASGELRAGENDTITIALKMKETAGNEYQNMDIGANFSIVLVATQLTSENEKDTFGPDYDSEATYPAVANSTFGGNDEGVTTKDNGLTAGEVGVDLPAGVPSGTYTLNIPSKTIDTDSNGKTTVSFEIELLRDGQKVEAAEGVNYPVSIKVGTGLDISGVYHNDEEITDFNYDRFGTGIISFTTSSFSPFSVAYTKPAVPGVSNVEDLTEAVTHGANFMLTQDIVLTEALNIPEGATVVLNMNGKTITNENGYIFENKGNLTIDGNGTLTGLGIIRSKSGTVTINNGNFYASSKWQDGSYQHTLKAENTTAIINGGNFDASVSGQTNAMLNASAGATITINGGSFKNVAGELTQFDPYIFTYEKDGKVIINDGTFYGGWRFNGETATTDIYGGNFELSYDGQSFHANSTHVVNVYGGNFAADAMFTQKQLSNVCAKGYQTYQNSDGSWTVEPKKINSYDALKEAVLNAENGDTITLVGDITSADGILIADKNITIDLNNYTFTITDGATTNNRNFKITGTSVVTIKNGTLVAEGAINSGAYGTVRTEDAANVHLENLKLYSYRGYGLNVKACTGTKITIEDTEIYAQYSGGIEAAGGTVELTNVNIEQEGIDTAHAWCSVALGVNTQGKMIVNSGTYSAAPIASDDNSAMGTWVAYVMSSGGTLEINGGTFNGTVAETASASNACGLICADTAAVVNINGGDFNSNGAILDMRNNTGSQPNPKATLAGGTFSADPTISGLYSSNLITVAEGYAVNKIDNNTWSVARNA